MAKRYSRHVSAKKTSQSQPILGKNQVQNKAGGYVYPVSGWTQFNRFLILGSEGGTYYAGEHEMTVENAKNVIACIKEDGLRAVREIVDVSDKGRAIKNDAAIFALALACTYGNEDTKNEAYKAVNKVCRIGTHIFQFCQAVQDLRKWSRGLRNAVARFYTGRKPDKLALQLVKYRQRDGWTHQDVLRLAHPSASDSGVNNMLRYAVGRKAEIEKGSLIEAFEKVQELPKKDGGITKDDVKTAVKLITENELPREALPTEFLGHVEIWDALLQHMPMTAMIRNLGKMTNVGLLKSGLTKQVKLINEKLADKTELKNARVHPMTILMAMKTYQNGSGFRGKLSWEPIASIVDALDEAFYKAFEAVEPTGQSWLLALDVSGSMSSPMGANSDCMLTCREASSAMALITANVESDYEIIGFTSAGTNMFSGNHRHSRSFGWGWDRYGVTKLKISPKQRLDDVVNYTENMPFGGTDCALPMLYAIKNELEVDTFVVYTDSESWAGDVHASQALQAYRKFSGKMAKLICVAMTATDYSIADPNDAGMLDVTGFDTSVPQVMAEFSKGTL